MHANRLARESGQPVFAKVCWIRAYVESKNPQKLT